jgi:hypothetical protein
MTLRLFDAIVAGDTLTVNPLLKHIPLLLFHATGADWADPSALVVFPAIYPSGSKDRIQISIPALPIGSQQHTLDRDTFAPTFKYILVTGYAAGMRLLHAQGHVHRDLNSANLLVDVQRRPVVSPDIFSHALPPADGAEPLLLGNGLPNALALREVFRAPELRSGREYSEAADVYAFGMFAFFLLAEGRIIQMLDMKVRSQPTTVDGLIGVIEKGIRFRYSPTIPGRYWMMIQRCWDANPANRPSFAEILGDLEKDGWTLKNCDEALVSAYMEFLQGLWRANRPPLPQGETDDEKGSGA